MGTVPMKRVWGILVLLGGMCAGLGAQAEDADIIVRAVPGMGRDFIRGVDISMLSQIEESGGAYRDAAGKPAEFTGLIRAAGVNWVRLRLWHTPVNDAPVLEGGKIISNKGQRVGGGNNDLERTIAMAKRARDAGMKVLLDLHYSDFWTDPGKQKKPAAWKDLSGDALGKALYQYTGQVLDAMTAAGCPPDMIQTGNELNNGMCWPDGRIWPEASEKVGGMEGFIALLQQGSKAVKDWDGRRNDGRHTPVVIHLADGGNNGLYRTVFDAVTKAGVGFDVIGMSYYNYWHGSLKSLQDNMNDMVARYGKSVAVMETAYGFTTADGDPFGNVFKVYNDDNGGYLPSVRGQATAVRDVMAAVAAVPGGKGLGIFYWEPGWIPVAGAGWRTGEGCAWENQAMFDFQGKALASLQVFGFAREGHGPAPVVKETLQESLLVPVGDKVKLPSRVKAVLTDGTWTWKDVAWDTDRVADRGREETRTVTGHLKEGNVPARLDVVFTFKKNLVEDPSFETGTLAGWTVSDPAKATLAENNQSNAHTGSWTWKYWLDKPFKAMLTRAFTGLPDGKYSFAVTSMGGGGENGMRIFARDFGTGKTLSVPVQHTGWKQWSTWTLSGIPVTNGQCTIGIYVDARAGNWGNFDDVEFWLEK